MTFYLWLKASVGKIHEKDCPYSLSITDVVTYKPLLPLAHLQPQHEYTLLSTIISLRTGITGQPSD